MLPPAPATSDDADKIVWRGQVDSTPVLGIKYQVQRSPPRASPVDDRRKRQTFAATPAEPGDLPWGVSGRRPCICVSAQFIGQLNSSGGVYDLPLDGRFSEVRGEFLWIDGLSSAWWRPAW